MTATLVRVAEDLLSAFKKDSVSHGFVDTQLKRLRDAADKKSNKQAIGEILRRSRKRAKAKKQHEADE